MNRLTCGLAVLLAPSFVHAQYFNIDMGVEGEVPGPNFGAAAHQPGHWNNFGGAPTPLLDVGGNATGVILTMTEEDGLDHGLDFGLDNFAGNTGNYALLLNDYVQIGSLMEGGKYSFTFSGLQPGDYRVITYGVKPIGGQSRTPVFVEDSPSQNPQIVTGPMPGNAFLLGATHARHKVSVSDGTIRVVIDVPPNGDYPAVINGFQLAPVPSTATLAPLGALILQAARRRRRGT